MSTSASIRSLRQVLDDRISQLLGEIEAMAESGAESKAAEAREHARREAASQLNQAVRRMRQAESVEDLCATLVDVAGPYATGVALFRLEGEVAWGERIRGVEDDATREFRAVDIPLSQAPALAAVVESRDPMATATAPSDISLRLADFLRCPPGGRAYIFPVVPRDQVIALVYAWGELEEAPLELLSQVAALIWSGKAAQPSQPARSGLIGISPAARPGPAGSASAWDRLPPDEQRIHLRAQRFARVQVAELRLRHATEVQAGRARGDLYGALREPIDAARDAFRTAFFEKCPSMVDYLHLELLQTLANDDAELLGKTYPGVMV